MSIKDHPRYEALYARARAARDAHPGLQRPLRLLNKVTRVRPPTLFTGWGLSTSHRPPWEDESAAWFQKIDGEVRALRYTGEAGIDAGSLDELRWRHWVVAWCVRYATTMSGTPAQGVRLAECGVADGTTAYFALSTAREFLGESVPISMHLYDSWGAMEADSLLPSEQVQTGRYARLSVELAKANLARFSPDCVYHVGYVPATFAIEPESPATVSFVHVDLNAATPTRAACDFFWPRLEAGGVFLFDDYGWLGFEDTKRAVDTFFAGKPGILMPMPTGQAAFLSALSR